MMEIPKMIYGTAWKEDLTAELVLKALRTGFRAVDTANQRKHYHEAGVGQGIEKFFATSGVKREDLFLQTKFTFARGQDHRKPYNENDPFAKQVKDSFVSSLQHLQTTYIDSYILHGPYSSVGITEEDMQVWRAMEELHASGDVLNLGVSNVHPRQLLEICNQARVKPAFVQNRCFARMGWDRDVREICRQHRITYQGFSLLTANVQELTTPAVYELTEEYGKTTAQIVFKFCQQIGIVCLTGTTNENHMKQDLALQDFELSGEAIGLLEQIAL